MNEKNIVCAPIFCPFDTSGLFAFQERARV
jgi:hypothetical protein